MTVINKNFNVIVKAVIYGGNGFKTLSNHKTIESGSHVYIFECVCYIGLVCVIHVCERVTVHSFSPGWAAFLWVIFSGQSRKCL